TMLEQPVAAVAVPSGQPTAPTNEPAKDEGARPVAAAAGGGNRVLGLPPEAEGDRRFVDGKKGDVQESRAAVPGGARVVQIGSRGTAKKIDVVCGGETTVSADGVEP